MIILSRVFLLRLKAIVKKRCQDHRVGKTWSKWTWEVLNQKIDIDIDIDNWKRVGGTVRHGTADKKILAAGTQSTPNCLETIPYRRSSTGVG